MTRFVSVLAGATVLATFAAGGADAAVLRGKQKDLKGNEIEWAYKINVRRPEEEMYNKQCTAEMIASAVVNGQPDPASAHAHCGNPIWWRPDAQYQFEYFHSGQFRMTYTEATAFCEETMGGRVVDVLDIDEAKHMVKLMDNNRHGFWLGQHRENDAINVRQPDWGFTKSNGDIEWDNFAVGEPNSGRDSEGVWVDACATQGTNWGNPVEWNDVRCDRKRRVVCKRDYFQPTCQGKYDPRYCQAFEANYGKTSVGLGPNVWTGPELDCPAGTSPTDGVDNKCKCQVKGHKNTIFSLCPLMCGSTDCYSTTTTAEPTTTTTPVASTTTTPAASTTTTQVATTTTSFATTTTSFATTTTTFATTTSTFATTTTTAEATSSTTGTTTTGVPSTTTTEAPITEEPLDLGACMRTPSRGWHSMNTDPDDLFKPVVDGGEPMHCCYKFHSTPRLSWDDAQATCEAFADDFSVGNVYAGLATPYVPEINTFLTDTLLKRKEFDACLHDESLCRRNAKGETTWIGGTTTNASRVGWANPLFAAYDNEDYGHKTAAQMASGATQYHFDEDNSVPLLDNGMFYDGEPSQLNMNRGRKGYAEDCLAQGGSRKRTSEFGMQGWNDAKCNSKKGYFCEYCVRPSTTTTAAPTTTTTAKASTTTTQEASTTTTQATTTTTQAPTTTTTQEPTTTTTAAPVPIPCDEIMCSDECGVVGDFSDHRNDHCGWSSKKRKCIANGVTRDDELGRAVNGTIALCPAYIVQPTEIPLETMFYKCAAIKCSSLCIDNSIATTGVPFLGTVACGWSKARGGRCLASRSGAYTNDAEVEARHGQCPPVVTPP